MGQLKDRDNRKLRARAEMERIKKIYSGNDLSITPFFIFTYSNINRKYGKKKAKNR